MNYEQQLTAVWDALDSQQMTMRECVATMAYLNMTFHKYVVFERSPRQPHEPRLYWLPVYPGGERRN